MSKSTERQYNEGDSVVFNIGLNELHGTITKVLTKEGVVDGRVAHGSKDEPRYAVEYEGTGTEQIRTESSIHKDKDDSSYGKDVQLTKDGHPDRRTTLGKEAAEKEEKEKSAAQSKSGHHEFEEGDRVVFNIGSNKLHGTVTRVLTKDGKVDGRVAHGSKDEPRYAVEYDGTGTEQIRTESSLEKDKDADDKGSKDSSHSSGGSHSSHSHSGGGSKDSKDSGSEHKFSEGDNVIFNIGLNELHGTVTRVLTKDSKVDGRVAHGSKDEPRYAVEYEGTGTEQIRTEGTLKPDDDKLDEDNSNKRKRNDDDSKDSPKDSKDSKSSEPSPKKTKTSK